MAGLILDYIIVWLFRLTVRGVGWLRSLWWPTETAVVEVASVRGGAYPYVLVAYTYEVANRSYSGFTKLGFYFKRNATLAVQDFPAGRRLTARYDQENPSDSFLMREEIVRD